MHQDSKLKHFLYKLALLIPDSWFLSLKYYKNFGRFPNLNSPRSFTEKMQWLKLHNRKDLYTRMVDKYEAKKYVADIIGEEYIIPTLGVWERGEDIDFDSLPNKFVLKATHDSGRVILCHDKSTFDKNKAIKEMNKSLKRNFYAVTREWPYKNVKPRIIAEEFIVDESGFELKDYKFFTFNGEVKFFKIDFNRFTNHKANYYDLNGDLLPFEETICPSDSDHKLPIPPNFEDMLHLVECLAKNIPFLRVDLYNICGKILFGELTFFPDSGMGKFNPQEWDERLGNLIKCNLDMKSKSEK